MVNLNEGQKEKFVFHHLRHTFCSQLALAGNDVATIMDLSGHKSYKMVLRYIKLNNTHKLKAVDTLEKKMDVKNSNIGLESALTLMRCVALHNARIVAQIVMRLS